MKNNQKILNDLDINSLGDMLLGRKKCSCCSNGYWDGGQPRCHKNINNSSCEEGVREYLKGESRTEADYIRDCGKYLVDVPLFMQKDMAGLFSMIADFNAGCVKMRQPGGTRPLKHPDSPFDTDPSLIYAYYKKKVENDAQLTADDNTLLAIVGRQLKILGYMDENLDAVYSGAAMKDLAPLRQEIRQLKEYYGRKGLWPMDGSLQLKFQNEDGRDVDHTAPVSEWVIDWWYSCDFVPSNDTKLTAVVLDGKLVAENIVFEELAEQQQWDILYDWFVGVFMTDWDMPGEDDKKKFQKWLRPEKENVEKTTASPVQLKDTGIWPMDAPLLLGFFNSFR